MKVTKIDITNNVKNFGKIMNVFNEVLAEGYTSNNEKSINLFKTYVKSIKENEVLKTQFFVYDNIQNKIEENEFKAKEFVEASIDLMSKFSKKDILEANKKLAELVLFEQANESEFEKLNEAISTLIFTEKTPNTIDAIVEAKAYVVDYIKNNKPKVVNEAIELPISMLSTVMVDKYNEKYAGLDESERAVIKALMESDENQKQEIYSNLLSECIVLVNETLTKYSGDDLNETELKTKDKLLRVKEKLLNDKKEITEDFHGNISRLFDLRSTLKK
jgi:hypothetical protein